MKTKFILFSFAVLILVNCKKEPEVVLDTPFSATISKKMFVSQYLKGIVISNNFGNVYLEKIISNEDKNSDLEIDILVGEEDKVCLTFVNKRAGGAYSNETFYNLKSGVIFDPKEGLRNPLHDTHEIIIEGVDSETLVRAGFGSIHSKNFSNNNLYLEVHYPENGAFFIFLWEKDDSNPRYFHIQNPESVFHLKDSDFLPLVKTKEYKMEVDTFGPDNSEVIGMRNNEPDFPILGKFDASGDVFSFYEIPGWDAERYRLTISKHNFIYREIVDELPNSFDFECDLDRSKGWALSPDTFEDEDLSKTAQYFRKQKVFMPNAGPPANYWSLEGIYEQNYFFILPDFSEELEATVPSLKSPYSVSWGSIQHMQFREKNQEIIEKFPFFSEEQFFDWGVFSRLNARNLKPLIFH